MIRRHFLMTALVLPLLRGWRRPMPAFDVLERAVQIRGPFQMPDYDGEVYTMFLLLHLTPWIGLPRFVIAGGTATIPRGRADLTEGRIDASRWSCALFAHEQLQQGFWEHEGRRTYFRSAEIAA